MKWSLRVARIFGVDVYAHATTVLLVVYVLWAVWPLDRIKLFIALGLLVLIVGSILLHEFGHVLAARWRGIPTRYVVLWPIGGTTHLETEAENPLDNLIFSIAGPLTNLALAALSFLALLGMSFYQDQGAVLPTGVFSIVCTILAGFNATVFTFNLIPVLPLDGGRVFWSLLLMLGAARHSLSILKISGIGIGCVMCTLGIVWKQPEHVILGAIVLVFALWIRPSKAFKTYWPTRIEWLCLILNANFSKHSLIEEGYLVAYRVGEDPNTVYVRILHRPDFSEEQVLRVIDDSRAPLFELVPALGWEDWVQIDVEHRPLMPKEGLGLETYLPTRLEWICLELNASQPRGFIADQRYDVTYMPSGTNQITAFIQHYPEFDEADLDPVVKMVTHKAKLTIQEHKWESWLEFQVKLHCLEQSEQVEAEPAYH